MFEPSSRYFRVEDATISLVDADGVTRTVSYKRRRFIVDPVMAPTLQHAVVQGERPDTITAHYLADPTQFWRVCDVNGVLRPSELTDEPGRAIRIPMIGP